MIERDWSSPGGCPVEAEETLQAMSTDAAKLAEGARQPWWNAWVFALVMTVVVGSLALDPPWRLAAPFVYGVIAQVSYRVYVKRCTVTPKERQKRIVVLGIVAFVALLILCVAAWLIYESSLSDWWGVVPAAAAGIVTFVVIRREEAIILKGISASVRDCS